MWVQKALCLILLAKCFLAKPTKIPRQAAPPRADGTMFNIDGVTKYWPGANAYWTTYLTDPDDIDSVFSNLASAGLKIIRINGQNDVNSIPPGPTDAWFQYLSPDGPQYNDGPNGLQLLDANIAAAEKYDLKVIFAFVNNYDNYGGMPAYLNAAGLTDHADFYTDPTVQGWYQAWIQHVIARYRDSPAIFAWELANEPRCSGCSTDIIYNWAAATSQYIKNLDPTHMVGIGDEGFGLGGDPRYPYTTQEGVDFNRNLQIATLDFGTFHLYPEEWGLSDDDANAYISAHASACIAAGKPCLLEEYGVSSTQSFSNCGIETPWQSTAVTSGNAADMFWVYGQALSTGTQLDGYSLYNPSDDYTCLVINRIASLTSGSV